MTVDEFIARWTAREGGAERANYQMFLSELCDVIGVPRPDPAGAERAHNDYVFERAVSPRDSAETTAPRRIDLYKRGAFILEAKQSRLPGGRNAMPNQLSLFAHDDGAVAAEPPRGWDAMMQNARKQAENYVFLLDPGQPTPPFIIVCDVGRCLEVYADFSGTGRAYSQFPDRTGFRILMDDLRQEEIRGHLAAIWTKPHSLDPTKESARVTREIAKRLAEVSKALEDKGANPEDVAHFLMRCLFTMFAEDTELLPAGSFATLLRKSVDDPAHFALRLKTLWSQMEKGEEFSHVIEARVRHFNGGLFKDTTVFELGSEEIGELLAAAKADWKQVDPAIFGTLLEQALSKEERKRLGAHYTPRAYVQRLVEVTVMEPLRADWQAALTKAQAAKDAGGEKDAVEMVRAFHHQLCTTRVLDPACGTGNFLYVSLELMKKLEGEVLQTLVDLGDPEQSLALRGETVDPHQFLGLELNPRAAAIAELVIWIGYLQWHYRNSKTHPNEPILRAFDNVNFGKHAGFDAVLTWDGYPTPSVEMRDGKRVETYPNACQPMWPEAEFIVGNPPFTGGKDLRSRMPEGYAEALWSAHRLVNESADFVMFWWDRAAELLTRPGTPLRRFGLVTTNSVTQVFDRRVIERYLAAKKPVSIVFAVPDHPWTKATKDAASVRIAMTVAVAGMSDGILRRVTTERDLNTDEPEIAFAQKTGRVNADLSVGVDITRAASLLAGKGICSPGVKLHGSGFVLTRSQAAYLGLGSRPALEDHIRKYLSGRDLTGHPRDRMVIDLFGLASADVRRDYPEVYQHLQETVLPERQRQAAKSPTRDAKEYAENWLFFGKPRSELRPALLNLPRYIATVETAKHRVFQFIEGSILPDNMITVVAIDDAYALSILSSRFHVVWTLASGGTLEDRPRYNKVRTFDPFPFPDPSDLVQDELRRAGDELDSHRKHVLADNPDLTTTRIYNIRDKVRAGLELTEAEEDVKRRGLVLILQELHERIDALTAEAYGWPADLTDEQIIERLVALNAERAKEEAAGRVRWLRPAYQIPRFAKVAAAKSGELAFPETVTPIDRGLPAFPKNRYEQPLAVEALLAIAGRPLSVAEAARGFRRGGKRIEPRVAQALATLARYGRISALPDGRFAARKVA
jgi:hypothetical protein